MPIGSVGFWVFWAIVETVHYVIVLGGYDWGREIAFKKKLHAVIFYLPFMAKLLFLPYGLFLFLCWVVRETWAALREHCVRIEDFNKYAERRLREELPTWRKDFHEALRDLDDEEGE